MLHKVIRNDDFWRNTALQHCCNVAKCYNIVPTLQPSVVTSPSAATATKTSLKGEFVLLQPLSRLFHLVQFVKCWQLELNSKRLYGSPGKEKESRRVVFTSTTKRKIRYFHFVVVQWRQCTKKRDTGELLFCQSIPIAFSPFLLPSPSPSSLFKFPFKS